jgi:hypothetical protein
MCPRPEFRSTFEGPSCVLQHGRLSGTSPARESCDQAKTWTIFAVHRRDENGPEEARYPPCGSGIVGRRPPPGWKRLRYCGTTSSTGVGAIPRSASPSAPSDTTLSFASIRS